MNPVARKLSYFIFGLGLPLATLQPAYADDIEIFTVENAITPKIMMILDTSLSMSTLATAATAPEVGKSRLTVMKEAMREFIEYAEGEGVHVGIMRMNERSGAVIFPVSDLSLDITETISSLNRPLTANNENAYENPTTGNVTSEAVDKSWRLPLTKGGLIGLRFSNISIPKNSIITKAYLELFPNKHCKNNSNDVVNCPDIELSIFGEKSSNSALFTNVVNNISSRPPTTNVKSYSITNWKSAIDNRKTIVIPGLNNIVSEITSQTSWQTGNALSLIIDTSAVVSGVNTNGFHSVISRFSPTLFIEFAADTDGIKVTRTISVKNKLLEALDNQKLTYHTPIVPALFEAVKYFQGQNLDSTHNANLTLTRSGIDKEGFYKVHERVAVINSFKNGEIDYPIDCNEGNLNSYLCRSILISPLNSEVPQYNSPIDGVCTNNEAAIILLTDGAAHHAQSGDGWPEMQTDIKTFAGIDSCVRGGRSGTGWAQTCGVELATNIRGGIAVDGVTQAQKIALYTIGFNNSDIWLQDLARQGETGTDADNRYKTANDSAALVNAFIAFTDDILKDTATFANSSTSISTTNRLRHNDTLYFALFKASDQSSWAGNLKRYQLHANGGIYDSNKKLATDGDGKFLNGAKSWWSTEPDGPNVAQGGAASVLATSTSRNIYFNAGTNNSLTKLANTTAVKSILTPSVFNVAETTMAETIIEWMLANKTIADPLHSTPTEISYSNGDPVIFFGDNQGYLHAIDSETGAELYAFMPNELLSNQKLVKDNLASVNGGHIYGMDGEIVQWQKSDGTKYIYSGMRRGGSSYYALNVTNRSTPTLEWQISPNSPGFSGLGQTWSKPVKTKIVLGSTTHDVLIFGGGYDPTQDNSNTRAIDTKGVGIYIVDADDGTLLWSATADNSGNSAMKYSFPSDVKAIDIDGDSAVDQIYVGDMGGQLWRFDVTNKNNNPISFGVIANIATDNVPANNRRFYHAPDVSVMKGHGGQVLAVAIGSGFRAHPNDPEIQDHFYMFKQPLTIEGSYPSLITESNLFNATSNIIGEGSEGDVNVKTSELNNADGWHIILNSGGEKVLASSLTVDHAIWFTTFQPSLSTAGCADKKGTSRLYRVGVSDATPNYLKVVPQDPNQAKLDSANSCGNVSCDSSDRSMILRNTTLPPRPTLINIGGKRLIGIGSEYYPALNNKTTNMYWSNSQ